MNDTPSKPSKQVATKPVAKKVPAVRKPKTTLTADKKTQVADKPIETSAPDEIKTTPKAASATTKSLAKSKLKKEGKETKEKAVPKKKPKLVRDSFTFPEADYAMIGALKQRALKAGCEVKKSELLRAGLATLSELSDDVLLQVLARVVKLKTGRPATK